MTVLVNHIVNPKAAVDLFGTTRYGVTNPATSALERSATEGPNGESAFKFFMYDGHTGDSGFYVGTYTLDAGTYALQWQYQTNSLVTNAHLVVRDEGYNVLAERHYGANAPWTQDSMLFTLSQRSTIQVLAGIGSYGSTSTGCVWYSRFALTKGTSVPPYFDGDTPDVAPSGSLPGHTYSWTGTAHKSTSTWDNNVVSSTPAEPSEPEPTPSTPSPTSGFTLVDFDDFSEGSSPSTTRWTVYDNGGSSGGGTAQPTTGWQLWADPANTVGTIRGNYTDPVIVSGIDYIVNTAGAKWLGQEWVPLGSDVTANAVAAAQAAGKRNVFIFYNIVGRDYGGSATGGAANSTDYLAWIDEQCAAIGSTYSLIFLEPDALPQVLGMLRSGQITQEEFDQRMSLLDQTVDKILAKCPNSKVYHDNGHSQWLGPSDMAYVLSLCGVAKCHGIAENISNFRPTADCEAHANGTIDILETQYGVPKGKLGYVIDTARNGAAVPPNPADWQNPVGIALGTRSRYSPTGLDGNPRKHGEVWCKVPGESDGPWNQGGDGIPPPAEFGTEPPAGTVFPKMVEHIIKNSVINQPSQVAGQAVIQSSGVLQILGQGDFTGGLTQNANKLKYGRWEVRTKLDRGPGYGPFVALKSTSIADGEIGFYSSLDGGADKVRFYVRGPNNTTIDTFFGLDLTVFHDFAVEWTADKITFFVDGGKAWEVTDTSYQPLAPLGVQMGLLIGSGNPIPTRTSATPQPFRFTVDSFSAFRAATTDPGTGSGGGGGVTIPDWYAHGAPPSMGVTKARQYARAIYDAAVSFTFTQDGMKPDMPSGAWRVKRPDQGAYRTGTLNGTVSEGMAYGMLMAVCYGNPTLPAGIYDPKAKAYFDGFWKYVKYYLNSRYLMDWSIDLNGDRTDTGGATDGDIDIALALVFAHRVWGSSGAVNYAAEATKMINAIGEHEFTPANHAQPNVMMNGDQWGADAQDYMPDYFRPGHMRVFYEHTKDTRWIDRIEANYPIAIGYFDRVYNTGMVPDWCDRASQPVPGQSYRWSYNGIRSPWVSIMEYLWFGPEVANPLAAKLAAKLAAFGKQVSGGDPANLQAEYQLDGTPTKTYNNIAFAQAFAMASVGSSANSNFASACLEYIYARRETDRTYFGTTLAALTVTAAAGLMPTFNESAQPEPNTAVLAIEDYGTSTDTFQLVGRQELEITDTGSSSDQISLRVPTTLSITDTGTSTDRLSASVDGSIPTAVVAINDFGTSTDSLKTANAPARIAINDVGSSSMELELSTAPRPVVRPEVSEAAQELYDGLGPLTQDDDIHGFPLLRFCHALTLALQEDYDLVRDGEFPGWSALLDADRAPQEALPWLGQFLGVDPAPGIHDEASQRLRLREASGLSRGTVAAIKGAARATLTGDRLVEVIERDGDPYTVTVKVYAGETPDRFATQEALIAAKPAGLVLNFVVASGVSYDYLRRTALTYDELTDEYPTYNDMRLALPPAD